MIRVGMTWEEPIVIPVLSGSILVVPGPPYSGSETSLLARPFYCSTVIVSVLLHLSPRDPCGTRPIGPNHVIPPSTFRYIT